MFLKIKNFLARFLPVPAKTFHKVIATLQKSLSEQKKMMATHQKSLAEQKKMMATHQKSLEEQKKMMDSHQKSLTWQKEMMASNQKSLAWQKEMMVSNQKSLAEQREMMATHQKSLSEQREMMASNQKSLIKSTCRQEQKSKEFYSELLLIKKYLPEYREQTFLEKWKEYRRNKDVMPYTEIADKHILNAILLQDRTSLLQILPQQAICAEIGVASGDYSKKIYDITNPTKLHLIDMWGTDRYGEECKQTVLAHFSDEIDAGKVVINEGCSTDVLQNFPDYYFDWVYIDTDHSYSTTAMELDLCRRKVKEQGIIAGHDFIMGNWNKGLRYGVVEAVYEFCVRHEWEIIAVTMELFDNSFVLRKMNSKTVYEVRD